MKKDESTKEECIEYILSEKPEFKRITDSVELLWGTAQLDIYLNRLLINNRIDREGFQPDIANRLMRLYMLNSENFKE